MTDNPFEHAFASKIAPFLNSPFTLIDIGSASGIEPVWRAFDKNLKAYAFEPMLSETKRLNAAETNPGVHYIPAFVGLPSNHPWLAERGESLQLPRDPSHRLSYAESVRLRRALADEDKKRAMNLWREMELADVENPTYLPDFFEEQSITDIDFIKIDVDGADFDILKSIEKELKSRRVLGLHLEVNYIGDGSDTEHSFHNTDRLMRRCGFDLFDLSVLNYSGSALPSRYLQQNPSKTQTGRPMQGDALYVLDLASPHLTELAETLEPEKLLKAAAIFALFNLNDCAAEILLKFRERISELEIDVDQLLDILAAQTQLSMGTHFTYKAYMEAFRRDDPVFYPPIKERTAEASRLEEELTAVKTELARVYQSKSWRATAPLRKISTKLSSHKP